MKKEIKVSLYLPENDSYVELWKNLKPEIGEPAYFARYTYQDEETWYYVSDPLGYCERSHPVSKEILFLCCDKAGREYCRYSNDNPNPLPKFETVVREEWEKVKKKLEVMAEPDHKQEFWLSLVGLTGDRFKQWLLSFKDPERYGKEIEAMYGYDENWLYSRRKEISSEPIPGTAFTYLGTRYCFSRIACRHKVCGVTWIEYHCTKAKPEWNEMYHHTESYGLFGYDYNIAAEGPMYDKGTAVTLVTKALKLSMPSDSGYYLITEKRGYQTLECYTERYLAEHMLQKNYRKTAVGDLTVSLVNTYKVFGTNQWIRRGNEVICIANKVNTKALKKIYPDIPEWEWLRAL